MKKTKRLSLSSSLIHPEILNQLDDYSKEFWIRFVSEFPQWTKYAEVSKTDGLIIKIPSENKSGEPPLFIIVDMKEVTIGFGDGHIDLQDWHNNRSNQAIFSEAIHYIHDIVDEQLVGITLVNGGVLASRKKADSYPWSKTITYVVSWKGTYNEKK